MKKIKKLLPVLSWPEGEWWLLHYRRSCREVWHDQEQHLCHRQDEQPYEGESRCPEPQIRRITHAARTPRNWELPASSEIVSELSFFLAASSARQFFLESLFADPSATDFLFSFSLADLSASQLSPPFSFADASASGFVCQSDCEVSK